jgi:hypothetical protein
LAAVRKALFNCADGSRKAVGFARRAAVAGEVERRSMGDGWAEPAESVCDDIEASGEKDIGAIENVNSVWSYLN